MCLVENRNTIANMFSQREIYEQVYVFIHCFRRPEGSANHVGIRGGNKAVVLSLVLRRECGGKGEIEWLCEMAM